VTCGLTGPSTRTPTGVRSLRSHHSVCAGYVHVRAHRIMRYVAYIALVLGFLAHGKSFAEGYEAWQFGMTKAEVRAQGDPSAYYSFSNGAVGSKEGPFEGSVVPISFYFSSDRLTRVMLLPYVGNDVGQAREAWRKVLQHLQRVSGGAEVPSLGSGPTTIERALAAFDEQVGKLPRGARHQAGASPMPTGRRIWASVLHTPDDRLMVSVNYGEP
jgi:hypothetical protein